MAARRARRPAPGAGEPPAPRARPRHRSPSRTALGGCWPSRRSVRTTAIGTQAGQGPVLPIEDQRFFPPDIRSPHLDAGDPLRAHFYRLPRKRAGATKPVPVPLPGRRPLRQDALNRRRGREDDRATRRAINTSRLRGDRSSVRQLKELGYSSPLLRPPCYPARGRPGRATRAHPQGPLACSACPIETSSSSLGSRWRPAARGRSLMAAASSSRAAVAARSPVWRGVRLGVRSFVPALFRWLSPAGDGFADMTDCRRSPPLSARLDLGSPEVAQRHPPAMAHSLRLASTTRTHRVGVDPGERGRPTLCLSSRGLRARLHLRSGRASSAT